MFVNTFVNFLFKWSNFFSMTKILKSKKVFLQTNFLLNNATQSLFHKNLNITHQKWSYIGLNFFQKIIYTNFDYHNYTLI